MTHKVFYNNDFNACEFSFETTRKSEEIAKSLKNDNSVIIVDPAGWFRLTETLVREVHSSEYVEAVQNGFPWDLAQSQGFTWDPEIYTMAIAHNSGVVAAVDSALMGGTKFAGTLSSGLHHAKKDSGEGYCTFNGLAVAAHHAIDHGLKRILILDFDAHFGGGTRAITDPRKVVQVDLSTSYFDFYERVNDEDWQWCSSVDEYAKQVDRALEYASSLDDFDLIIYNAGMDPANQGVDCATLLGRETMVRDWAGGQSAPLVYTMAGGYFDSDIDMDGLVALHRLTIDTFASE